MRVLARDSLCPARAEGPCVFGTGQVSHTSELVLAPGHTLRLENELHPSYCCVFFSVPSHPAEPFIRPENWCQNYREGCMFSNIQNRWAFKLGDWSFSLSTVSEEFKVKAVLGSQGCSFFCYHIALSLQNIVSAVKNR